VIGRSAAGAIRPAKRGDSSRERACTAVASHLPRRGHASGPQSSAASRCGMPWNRRSASFPPVGPLCRLLLPLRGARLRPLRPLGLRRLAMVLAQEMEARTLRRVLAVRRDTPSAAAGSSHLGHPWRHPACLGGRLSGLTRQPRRVLPWPARPPGTPDPDPDRPSDPRLDECGDFQRHFRDRPLDVLLDDGLDLPVDCHKRQLAMDKARFQRPNAVPSMAFTISVCLDPVERRASLPRSSGTGFAIGEIPRRYRTTRGTGELAWFELTRKARASCRRVPQARSRDVSEVTRVANGAEPGSIGIGMGIGLLPTSRLRDGRVLSSRRDGPASGSGATSRLCMRLADGPGA
jgi:hypothetical protein